MIDLRHGDMRDVLPTIEAESVHSVVTDPPYHLTTMARPRPDLVDADNPYARRQAKMSGFMGKDWDGGSIAFDADTWRAVHRVLKPGGYLLAMGGTRTFHRLACAIEDAGFEVRDTIAWVYGSGFPKSLDIGKAIDRAAGAEREVVGIQRNNKADSGVHTYAALGAFRQSATSDITAPATDAARQWNGWGTALKPSIELVCVARKPLSERTVAGNVLRHGTGGINVDACRVGMVAGDRKSEGGPNAGMRGTKFFGDMATGGNNRDGLGRWPANLCHDGSPEVEAAFAAFGTSESGVAVQRNGGGQSIWGDTNRMGARPDVGFGDTGSASRFFYSAKATASDRADSRHPTIKPVDLIRWLTRLVTPPGGTVLDPFAGSGTTGEAAMLEGFNAILIEREVEHTADIEHRVKRWRGADLPLFAS